MQRKPTYPLIITFITASISLYLLHFEKAFAIIYVAEILLIIGLISCDYSARNRPAEVGSHRRTAVPRRGGRRYRQVLRRRHSCQSRQRYCCQLTYDDCRTNSYRSMH